MRLLQKQNIEDILFFDIETAPADGNFDEKSPLYDAWVYDQTKNLGEDETEEDLIPLYFKMSPLMGEFGRIACITIGAVRNGEVILKTFADKDEKKLLEAFNESVIKFATNKTWLCGHNILDFDMPFIMKRCLVNRVPLHLLFDTAHLKPWETAVLDTAVLWKGTGWKKQSFISVLSALGLPSPKDDISGADVGRLFYEGEIDRIVTYCEKDVFQTINLMRALRYEDPFEEVTQLGDYTPIPKKVLTYLFEGGEYDDAVREQLKSILGGLNSKDKAIAIEILNTIPTKAKGKETFITKADIKELC
jgi:3'-5' exonuclease